MVMLLLEYDRLYTYSEIADTYTSVLIITKKQENNKKYLHYSSSDTSVMTRYTKMINDV